MYQGLNNIGKTQRYSSGPKKLNEVPFKIYPHSREREKKIKWEIAHSALSRNFISTKELFPSTIQDAAKNFSPALIANYSLS